MYHAHGETLPVGWLVDVLLFRRCYYICAATDDYFATLIRTETLKVYTMTYGLHGLGSYSYGNRVAYCHRMMEGKRLTEINRAWAR